MSSSTGTVVFNDAKIQSVDVVATEGLGVGTINPQSNLHVVGNAYVTSNMVIDDTLDVTGEMNLRSVSNTASIKYNSNVVTEYVRSKKLIKYPRVAMTGATTSGYTASASSWFNSPLLGGSGTDFPPWKAFDNVGNHSSGQLAWYTFDYAAPEAYSGTDNAFNPSHGGTATPSLGVGTVAGEWIKINLPEKIVLHEYNFYGPNLEDEFPRDWTLYGSIDDTTWVQLDSRSDQKIGSGTSTTTGSGTGIKKTYTLNSLNKFNYYAFVVTKSSSNRTRYFGIGEIELYGTPEYDPEAHGTDVIVRSVPNVPNTDWLEVYYDGQDYTSMPSSVTDKSGNGVTGTPSGGVGFDSSQKSFTFDGTDDYIDATISLAGGDYVHSFSAWMKLDDKSHEAYLFHLGNQANNQSIGFHTRYNDNEFRYFFYGNDLDVYIDYKPHTWYHICGTYSGGGTSTTSVKLYVNGVHMTPDSNNNLGSALSTPTSTTLYIGRSSWGTYLNGSIANFRLFNRALSADEVWQLYAYQKEYFQVSPDVLTFKGGRLGVGTEEPRAPLDVMGIPYGPGATPRFFVRSDVTTTTTTAGTVRFNYAQIDSHNGFNPSTYTYTVQVAGVYRLLGDVLLRQTQGGSGGAGSRIEIRINGSRTFSSYGAGKYNTETTITVHGIYYCNVGDTINMYHTGVSNGDIYISAIYQGFSGFLLC